MRLARMRGPEPRTTKLSILSSTKLSDALACRSATLGNRADTPAPRNCGELSCGIAPTGCYVTPDRPPSSHPQDEEASCQPGDTCHPVGRPIGSSNSNGSSKSEQPVLLALGFVTTAMTVPTSKRGFAATRRPVAIEAWRERP